MADDENVALKLLTDRRDELVMARTHSVCRLHRLIRELIPGGAPRELTAERADDLISGLTDVDNPAELIRLELAMEHIHDIRRFNISLDRLAAASPG